MRRKVKGLTGVVILFGLLSLPGASVAQSGAPPGRPPAQIAGRFQLVPQQQGTMFLVDTATGRVWRYTSVTPSESDVKAYVDAYIEVQETTNGRPFPEGERRSLYEKLAKERRDELQESNNPCKGLVTCFVEVDRVRLTQTGWISEIISGK